MLITARLCRWKGVFLPILSCLEQVSGIQLEFLRKQNNKIINSFHVTGRPSSGHQCDYYRWRSMTLERKVATKIFSPLVKSRFLAATSHRVLFWKRLCYYSISQWVRRSGVVMTRCPTVWHLPGNLTQSPQEAELLRLQLMFKDACTCSSFVHQFINSKNIDWATPRCQPLGEEGKWGLVLKSTQTGETEKHVIMH